LQTIAQYNPEGVKVL